MKKVRSHINLSDTESSSSSQPFITGESSSSIQPIITDESSSSSTIDNASSKPCLGDIVSTFWEKPKSRLSNSKLLILEAVTDNTRICLLTDENPSIKKPAIKKIGRRVPSINKPARGRRLQVDVRKLKLDNNLTRPLLLNDASAATGSKAKFRHETAYELNYREKPPLAEKKVLNPLSFVETMSRIGPKCPRCKQNTIKPIVKDIGIGSPCVLTCQRPKCGFTLSSQPDNIRGDGKITPDSHYSQDDMAFTYDNMCNGRQFKGYEDGADSLGLNHFTNVPYAKIRTKIQNLNDEMWDDNIDIGHQLVKKFYEQYFPERVSACKQYVWPIVSIDGSFDKRGFHALHGISMVYEIYTGICLDTNNLEKCKSCTDKVKINYNGKKSNPKKCDILDFKRDSSTFEVCPHNLFHGQSAEMEGENAFIIFNRSMDYGFQYRTYISDGDNKVWSRLANIL